MQARQVSEQSGDKGGAMVMRSIRAVPQRAASYCMMAHNQNSQSVPRGPLLLLLRLPLLLLLYIYDSHWCY